MAGPFNLEATEASVHGQGYTTFIGNNLSEDLESVPGIGPDAAAALKRAGVFSTLQLLGTFLALHSPGMSQRDHLNEFVAFLSKAGIRVRRSLIARAIAEKCNTFIPGLFDEESLA
jgi:hypothetical protein